MDHIEATIREATTRLRGLLVNMPGQIKQLEDTLQGLRLLIGMLAKPPKKGDFTMALRQFIHDTPHPDIFRKQPGAFTSKQVQNGWANRTGVMWTTGHWGGARADVQDRGCGC